MKVSELRERHPRFVYKSFHIAKKDNRLCLSFNFLLEPDIFFSPEVVLPAPRSLKEKEIENFIFHLGLIEMISYWKAACPPEILIKPGQLNKQQTAWWHDLFIHGLGEFFYQNKIDFTGPDFLRITSNQDKKLCSTSQKSSNLSGDLILVSGGKDSPITLELLKSSPGRKGFLLLNPTQAALETVRIADYSEPLIVRREIDPKLLELNRSGYLNGHTPFSAYLAFLGVFMADLHGYEKVIVSNERSADEENLIFHNLKVNHQYSKSSSFERLFCQYSKEFLNPNIQYFSFLRPLYEIQIAKLFAGYPKYHFSFRSCNIGQKENSWCGACPKCAFSYLILSPFFPVEKMERIFGEDFFLKSEIAPFIRQLVRKEEPKPFECVGTREESILALALAIEKYQREKKLVPPLLSSLKKELGLDKRAIWKIWKKF